MNRQSKVTKLELGFIGFFMLLTLSTLATGASFGPKVEVQDAKEERRKTIELTGILENVSEGKHDLNIEILDNDSKELLFFKEFKGVEVREGFYTLFINTEQAGLEVGKSYGLRIEVSGEDVPVIEARLEIVPGLTVRALGEEGQGVSAGLYNITGNYPYPDAVVTVTNRGTGYGIKSVSQKGVGLHAESNALAGYGLYAKNTAGGTAFKAEGDADVTGRLTVGSVELPDGSVDSGDIVDGTIGDADIAPTAAIAAGKINRSGLDADTLDGNDSTKFAVLDAEGNMQVNGNLNVNGTGNNYFASNVGIGMVPRSDWKLDIKTGLGEGDGVSIGTPGGKPGLAFWDNAGNQQANMGIDPASGTLHIWSNQATDDQFVLNNFGQVGIGTASPGFPDPADAIAKLHIVGGNLIVENNIGETDLRLRNEGIGGKEWRIRSTSESSGHGAGKLVFDIDGIPKTAITSDGSVEITSKVSPQLIINNPLGGSSPISSIWLKAAGTGKWLIDSRNNNEDRGDDFWISSGNDIPEFMIDQGSGIVGIGTKVPDSNPDAIAKLHIVGGNLIVENNIGETDLRLRNEGIGGKEWRIRSTSETSGHGAGKLVFDIDGALKTAITSDGNLNVVGDINGQRLCIAGICQTSWPGIGGNGTGNFLSKFISPTTLGDSSIFDNGNVGIGTMSPRGRIDVKTNLAGGDGVSIGTPGGKPGLIFWDNNGDQEANIAVDQTAGSLHLWTGVGGSPDKFVLTNSGNLGIGTGNPSGVGLGLGGSNINGRILGVESSDSNAIYLGNTTTGNKLGIFSENDGRGNFGSVGTVSNNAFSIKTNNQERITVTPDGRVGIGTTNPAYNPNGNISLDVNGTIYGNNVQAHYQDLAEWVPSSQNLEPATVVVIDPENNNQVIASTQAYDSKVAGVVSAQPGFILGEGGEGQYQIAHTGRVKARVDASYGAIAIGDLLVTSPVEGTAMKSQPKILEGEEFHRPGTILGKALEPLSEGQGEILVLLSLQ